MKIASLFLSLLFAVPALAETRPVDWVKPQIDTVKPRWFYFNSACRPFGMVNLSPDTQTKGTGTPATATRTTRSGVSATSMAGNSPVSR